MAAGSGCRSALACRRHTRAHVCCGAAGAVPQDQQRLTKLRFERLEKLDDLLLLDSTLVEAKAHAAQVHASDQRQMIPVEAKLHHRGFAFGCPRTHACVWGAATDPIRR